MKKFTFTVDLVDSDLDTQKVVESLQKDLDQNFTGSFASVKAAGIKQFSEQGFKVWRARTQGVTVKQAGDAHVSKVPVTEATPE